MMILNTFNDIMGSIDDNLNIYFMLALYPNEAHTKLLEKEKIPYDDLAYLIAEEDPNAKYLASLDAVKNFTWTQSMHIKDIDGNDRRYTIEKTEFHRDSCLDCAFNPISFKRKYGIQPDKPPHLCTLREIYNMECNIDTTKFHFKER